ncbi:MAG: EAL domain-containing protein [Gammaproteobacteria bacterium]|nr:MAG: EAL domain-containing protein [Gammaproteobacteria bacterium]
MRKPALKLLLQYSPFLALASGLLVTGMQAAHERTTLQTMAGNRFEQAVHTTQALLERRMNRYLGALEGVRALYAASQSVERHEFRTYVQSLNLPLRYPGLAAVQYTPRETPATLDDFHARLKEAGLGEFKAWDLAGGRGGTLRAAGEYLPVEFIEPYTPLALAFDVSSGTANHEALRRARDQGLPALSGKITGLLEGAGDQSGDQPGFLLFVPIYRNGMPLDTVAERRAALQGYVSGVFHARDLLGGIYDDQAHPHIDFAVFDGAALTREALLYDDDNVTHALDPTHQAAFATARTLAIAGHSWTLYFSSLPEFDAQPRHNFPLLILMGGTTLSVLLFWVIWLQVKGRAEAERISAELRENQMRLSESAQLLKHQALHDALTRLPNRALLEDRLQQSLLAGTRDPKPLALLIMDLDRFKEVNDTLGHHAGDQLLQQIALRLQNALRKSDTIARLGGDEFAVLLPGADAEGAVRTARTMLTNLEAAFPVEGRMLDARASIGIALSPAHGTDAVTLLRHADIAMYTAKHARHGYALYDSGQDQNSLLQLTLTSALDRAIAHRELTLYYQPRVDFKTGRVTGAEALVRWQHPERGLIAPDEFIPLAERTGLIRPLTQRVLSEALRQCAAWRHAGIEMTLSVNLSARDFQENRLCEMIASQLSAWDVPPHCLEFDIPEDALTPAYVHIALLRLDAMGVRLSIDCFGSGHSSLPSLKRLPLDTFKIDRSLIKSMTKDNDTAVIVRSAINLAHDLGLGVVAEGVEDQQTWDRLDEFGCDAAQGFFLSPPLPPDDLLRWIQQRNAETAHNTKNNAADS